MANEVVLSSDDIKVSHCDNPISLDEIEEGLWLGELEILFKTLSL